MRSSWSRSIAIAILDSDKKVVTEHSQYIGRAPRLPVDSIGLAVVSLAADDELAASLALLSPDERDRAARIPNRDVRRRYVLARAALREALGVRTTRRPGALRFEYGERGKPRLAGPGPEFNLSHSGDLAVIAVSDRGPVGVDLERLRPRRRVDLMARRILAPPERERFERTAVADRAELLLRCWTAKEAVAKALGDGLAIAPRRIAVRPAGPGRAVADVAADPDGPCRDGAAAIPVYWLEGLDRAVGAVAGPLLT
jgi:4'-phosphopantetheinyl transferase